MTTVHERLLAALNAIVLVAIAAALLSGCNGPITQTQADNANAQVHALCGTAMSLAPAAGPMAIDILAACGGADVVADLATKPGAVAYLDTLIAKAKTPH